MTEEEVIELIKNNLEIYIDTETHFGPVEMLRVSVEFMGEPVATSTCSLPS